jgi:rhodanese-related sulfurtransferase
MYVKHVKSTYFLIHEIPAIIFANCAASFVTIVAIRHAASSHFCSIKIVLHMNNNAIIIDVRSRGEYEAGCVPGSLNIPLHEIPERLEEIKALQQPILLCCASGNRSGQATYLLKEAGIACENGGSWFDVMHRMQHV